MSRSVPPPKSIRDFASRQVTRPLGAFNPNWDPKVKQSFPYHEYIYPMVAGLLLSGRVRPIQKNGLANKTEMTRWCKESNFNPHLCGWIANILIRGGVIERKFDTFIRGPRIEAVDELDHEKGKEVFLAAFHEVIDARTPRGVYRSTFPAAAGFEGYIRALAKGFRGLALAEESLGDTLLAFSELPKKDLEKAAGELSGLGDRVADSQWFDSPGQKAFIEALGSVGGFEWRSDDKNRMWVHLSDDLYTLLGLAPANAKETLSKEFVVQSDLTVIVGCHHPLDSLALLCRFGTVANKGQTLTFKLDAKTIKESGQDVQAITAFKKLLESHQPKLPSTVAALLSGGNSERKLGKLRIRGCRALIKPDTPELLDAIRGHRRLKGYLMSGAPPGYLLIKETSDPFNFMKRCRELGFEITGY